MKETKARTRCSVAALVMAAGGACPVALASDEVSLSPDRTTIIMDGRVAHQAREPIGDHQVLQFAASPTIMVTWKEGGASYYAISRTGERFDRVAEAGNKVRLRYATFDPHAEEPPVPAALRAGAGNELFLVQFVGTPLEEMRGEIRALGGSIERFLTDNTHIVRMPPPIAERVRTLPYVRWVGAHHPAYRVDEPILALVAMAAAGGQENRAAALQSVRYSIEIMGRGLEAQEEVGEFITRLGGVVDYIGGQRRMEATLTLEQVLAVAQRNDISFIDAWGPPGTAMHVIRQLGGAVPLLNGLGLTGEGVRAEIIDSEIQLDHPQWAGQPPLLRGMILPSLTHGTTCYGIAFATGNGNAQAAGMLPGHELGVFGFFKSFTLYGTNRITWNLGSVDPQGPYRVVFQTNSWGRTPRLDYSTFAAEMDDAIYQSGLLVVQGQGNTGNRNSVAESWAKNAVSVGGIGHRGTLTRNDDRRSGASTGPAADGRVKPDLAHCYDNIYTTTVGSGYTTFAGTSGSTPITAGHFGLLHQMWHEGMFDGWGGAPTMFESRPHYTLARAIALATAYRYQWVNPPFSTWAQLNRDIQGWGMIDLQKIYNLRERSFFINANEYVQNAEMRQYQINVEPGEPELLISMVYTDPPGSVAAAQARINDLTLKVTSPGKVVYYGNNGLRLGNWSTPGGPENTIDTAENIFVQSPEMGAWTVEVIGAQVIEDTVPSEPGIQASFAVAVFGGTGRLCYANCDSSTTAPVLNIADFSCFLQKFAAGDPYANCDDSTTPPVLNVADFSCFLQKFAAGCP